MTASKYVRARGLPSLVYVAGMVNKPPETLNNWYRDNFDLFEVVVLGCVELEYLKVKGHIKDE